MKKNKPKPIVSASLFTIVGFCVLLGAFILTQLDSSSVPTPVFPSRRPMVEGVSTVVPATDITIESPEKAVPAQKTAMSTATNATTNTKCTPGAFDDQFICLLNDYRMSKGKKQLSYDSNMNTVAFNYSVWMKRTGTFSHRGPNGSIFTDRCSAAGLTCYGENLAKGFTSAKNLLAMWKASPTHNQNLLSNTRFIGLGTHNGYATLLFR